MLPSLCCYRETYEPFLGKWETWELVNKGMTPKEETRKKPVVCFSAGVNI